LQRLVDAECADRVTALERVGDLRQIHDRARCDQAITELLVGFFADADCDANGVGRVAEQDVVAIGERDFPACRGIDRDAATVAFDRGAVGRAQVAKHEVLADLRDLRVVTRQMKVGDDDGARRRSAERGRTSAREDSMQTLRRGAVEDF
jgi:hypothetical protein